VIYLHGIASSFLTGKFVGQEAPTVVPWLSYGVTFKGFKNINLSFP
jgi:hypothetical protein